jgi:hypothetical protein
MIRINHSGGVPFFQNDTSYNLPSSTGAVQWNGMSKKFQVSNGTAWLDIENSVTLNADHDYLMVMRWAREKMHEEHELERLAKENPTLKDLVDQLNYTKEQIKVVTTLLKA